MSAPNAVDEARAVETPEQAAELRDSLIELRDALPEGADTPAARQVREALSILDERFPDAEPPAELDGQEQEHMPSKTSAGKGDAGSTRSTRGRARSTRRRASSSGRRPSRGGGRGSVIPSSLPGSSTSTGRLIASALVGTLALSVLYLLLVNSEGGQGGKTFPVLPWASEAFTGALRTFISPADPLAPKHAAVATKQVTHTIEPAMGKATEAIATALGKQAQRLQSQHPRAVSRGAHRRPSQSTTTG